MKPIILFASASPYDARIGGVDRVIRVLRTALEERGYTTLYFNPTPDASYDDNLAKYRAFIKDNKISVVINQTGLLGLSKLFLSTGATDVKTISVLHNDPRAGLMRLWAFFSERRNSSVIELVKRVIRIGLFPYFFYKERKNLIAHFEFLGSNSDKIVLLSDSFKPYVADLSHAASIKSISIPNPNTYREEELNKPCVKERIILYVGRLDNYSKRVDLLLKIWREASRVLLDWRLILVGTGPDELALKEMSAALRLERIEFVGHQNPRRFYEMASVLCLTSRFEGFGMVLTEAQQYGVVPIAFQSYASVTDIIQHGETGILVKPFQLKTYVKELVKVCQNDNIRKYMSTQAQNSVRKFDVDIVVSKWINLLENI